MLSKSANPSLATPSQAPIGEGVETGWEPPDRVTAKVKAQSGPRTLGGSGGGESRSGMGSGESWFEPRRGNSERGGIAGPPRFSFVYGARVPPLGTRRDSTQVGQLDSSSRFRSIKRCGADQSSR